MTKKKKPPPRLEPPRLKALRDGDELRNLRRPRRLHRATDQQGRGMSDLSLLVEQMRAYAKGLTEDDLGSTDEFISRCREWADELEAALAATLSRAEEAEKLAERYGNALERVMMTANGALETGETVAAQLPQEGSE